GAALGQAEPIKTESSAQRWIAAAHIFDDRREAGPQRRNPFHIRRAAIHQRVDQIVLLIEDEDVVMVEIRLEPNADARLRPFRIEGTAYVLDCRVRGRDAFDFAQNALAKAR